jgi:hypothetical protein
MIIFEEEEEEEEDRPVWATWAVGLFRDARRIHISRIC